MIHSRRLFLLPLLFGLTLCRAQPEAPAPTAQDGVLVLGRADLVDGRILRLDGEWEFYWKRLIEPEEFATGAGEPDTMRVPGAWNGHPGPEGPLPGEGFATYRLVVKSERNPPGLALRVPTMHTAFLLFVNGRRVAANGQVGPSADWSRPAYQPQVTDILPAGPRLELVLQISNFHHRKGGTWKGIELGRASDLHRERETGLLLDFFLLGALAIMGFYHLLLYAFRRGRDSVPLFLGIFCLLIGLRILTTGEHYLALLLADFPWEAYVKLQYVSYYLAVPVWGFFIRGLFPKQFKPVFLHLAAWPTAACVLWVLALPVRSFSYSMFFFEPFTILLGTFLVIFLLPALWRGEDGIGWFMIGWLLLFASIVNDVLVNREIVRGVALVPLGVFGFILVQSGMLARHFSRARDVAEKLSADLESGIRERTAELKASRDELRLARDRAEDSSRAKSEFLAAMSHEIRTPLNSILGTAGLLAESELAPEQRHQVKILNRAGSKLLNLINEVLDLSRIEAGKQELEEIGFDPVQASRELLGLIEQKAREKAVALNFAVTDDFPRSILGDRIRLEQILLNLLGNALKFTERGSIELSLRRRKTSLGEDRLEFAVRDTGIGIPPEKMPQIFDSFMQVDQAASRRYEGSGLGLSISKRLVELMEGEISVDSRPGLGSEFRFAIPYRPVSAAVPPTPAQREEQVRDATRKIAPGTRVLLVEDNEDNRYLIQAFLARVPVELSLAENGAEAVARIQAEEFQLVLMDIQMPVMDGYQATRVVRSYEEESGRPATPIVALTANATMEALRKSQQAGCNDHLTKPVDRERLLEIIARYAGEN